VKENKLVVLVWRTNDFYWVGLCGRWLKLVCKPLSRK